MAQELIPKEKIKKYSVIGKLFLPSLIFLIILGGSYVFLRFKNSSLQSKITDTNNQIIETRAKMSNTKEKYVFDTQDRIEDFSNIFRKHKTTSNFLALINELVYEDVKFSDLNLQVEENNVILEGVAKDFDGLGKQMLIFQKSEFIKGLNISNISFNKEGKVEFSIRFSLDSKIF